MKTQRALLTKFLNENNALHAFMNNLETGETMRMYWHRVKEYNPHHLIAVAFSWNKSHEGFDYWNELDDKWRSLIYKATNQQN